MRPWQVCFLCLLAAANLGAQPRSVPIQAIRAELERHFQSLESLYQDLHRHPELSGHEVKTAAKIADQMKQAGFVVTSGLGGTGVVGVLRNGPGPTLLLRTELDALPLQEKTGLPYASQEPGVMHACGHDLHMTCLTGAATLLNKMKDRWRGTLVLVAQPAEETVGGARAMIADGLFTRFPKPDFALALHDTGNLPSGQVAWTEGYAFANVDSVDITIFGKGGHGARPNSTVDPIVIAARTVLALQTLVSREKDPMEPGVITVGSIHAGTKHNIIPDEAKLQLTVRSYAPAVRKQLLDGVVRIAKAEAVAARAPKEPAIAFSEGQDALYNDPTFIRRLAAALGKGLGAENVVTARPEMGAEDFGEIGKAAGIPSAMLRLGAVEPGRYAAAQASGEVLPSPHSPLFAPDRERSIRTGVEALVLASLEVLAVP
ncbi:N-acyl-L-amino acid amidohydrolase [Geothrix limicola]|uniref:N-acyl-L-amino acid amidohydrolase n=1 Tax=Geothrix limicola TaxID=2927978 RepID=A0ABQ5QDF9_9BACT|nr:amidohydrolase [Geothrix limicola]GLH72880.1 N-acyl-L-amino acid amidohydrolase [Geothrix limicola]